MKKLSDEEIQKLLEQKLDPDIEITGESLDDLAAYRFLFEALEKEPVEGLAYDFPKKVARQVQAAADRRQERKWRVYSALLVILAIAVVAGYLFVYNDQAASQLFEAINAYRWVILFVFAGIIAIQYADKKLIKKNKGLI